MFGDFEISKNGDLLFQKIETENTSLRLKFTLTRTNALKIGFDLEEFELQTPSENALKISFDIKRKTANEAACIVRGRDADAQLISIKLRTVLGELPQRKEIGSKLASLMHKEINETTLRLVEDYVKECISDIVQNPTVTATPYISYNNGYSQTVKVEIHDDTDNLLTYILER